VGGAAAVEAWRLGSSERRGCAAARRLGGEAGCGGARSSTGVGMEELLRQRSGSGWCSAGGTGVEGNAGELDGAGRV